MILKILGFRYIYWTISGTLAGFCHQLQMLSNPYAVTLHADGKKKHSACITGKVRLNIHLSKTCSFLQNMRERNSAVTTPPKVQKIERLQSLQQEHKDALERAVSLNIPHAVTIPEEEEPSTSKEQNVECDDSESFEIERAVKSQPCGGRTNWNMVVEKLLKKDESGELLFKKDAVTSK